MAAAIMKPAASRVSGRVTVRRERIRAPTGRSYWIDRPGPPRRARPTHCTYWTGTGWSRPSAWRTRATESALASSPRMMRAGSPGSTRTTTKTSRETKRRVIARAPTRRITYSSNCIAATSRASLLPGHLGEVLDRRRELLPEAGHPLLGDDEPGVHVEPDRGGLVGEHLLHLHVERAAGLVVARHLRLRVELLGLGAVPAEVVLRVRDVADVSGLRVADDRHVVVGGLAGRQAEHLGEPLTPLDLLDGGADADLGELARHHLGGAHRVVVLGRDLEDRVEAVRVAGLGQELLGLRRVVAHALGDVHEVGIGGIHVGAEDLPVAEHRPLQDLVLVDRVGDGEPHPLVRVGLLAVVH